MASPLPIDPYLDDLCRRLRPGSNLVLVAEPGAGKTTRLPPAMLRHLPPPVGILVLEPRRLAARLAAARVAEEAGERMGATVGYQVRFEAVRSPQTRLLFITEGLLIRRLQSSPSLADVALVVLDEFHERHLAGDVSLAMVRRLQRTVRPDLRIVVMSATMDPHPVAAFLGSCDIVEVPGRTFPLEIEYATHIDPRPLEVQVADGVQRVLQQRPRGDMLVFLPGAREIRRSMQACTALGDLDIRALHGEMTLDDQRLAILPSRRRKVVLATNVAESSITIEGVQVVIDSGLARVARHSHWSGLPRLDVERISQASATQRAGRAGRTGPGLVLRLYSRADHDLRPAFDTPEIHRSDLTETLLELLAAGVDPSALEWFDAPSAAAVEAAWATLARLDAIAPDRRLTPRGARMGQLPVHPRLAALVLAGDELQVGDAARCMAALLSYRDILLSGRGLRGGSSASGHGQSSDLVLRLERFRRAAAQGMSDAACQQHGLDRSTALQVQRLTRSLGGRDGSPGTEEPSALLRAILMAFPDRLAFRPRLEGETVLLSRGGSASLSPESSVRGPWLVALDAEERHQAGRSGTVVVRMASELDPDWLYEAFIESLVETRELRYNDSTSRVELTTRLMYDQLPLEESMRVAPPGPETARCLATAAWKSRLQLHDNVAAFRHRYDFLRGHRNDLPPLDDDGLQQALQAVARNLSSMADLRKAVEAGQLARALVPEGVSLDALAPLSVSVPRRRNIPIHYEPDRPPWIASRLQDFFGLKTGPAILQGRVPLVLHLLAPNGRDVQVTSDLAGFWQRTYPQVRKSLHRQYPKHAWPEDPMSPNRASDSPRRPPGGPPAASQ